MSGVQKTLGALALWLLVVAGCSSAANDDSKSPEAFCAALRDATTQTAAVGELDLGDSGTIEAATASLTDLVELAPDAIAADVAVVSEVYGEVLGTLAATTPGDRDDALRELQPRLDEAAGPASSLERYAVANCRLRFEGPAEPTPTPTPVDLED